MSAQTIQTTDTKLEIVLFRVGNFLCGIPISDIQEIKKIEHVTHVYNAPDYVKGVIQLRGQIVTIVDTAIKLSLEPTVLEPNTRIVVVKQGDEFIGLLVDEVEDSIQIERNFIEVPPNNMQYNQIQFLQGVLKLEDKLVCILSISKILQINSAKTEKTTDANAN